VNRNRNRWILFTKIWIIPIINFTFWNSKIRPIIFLKDLRIVSLNVIFSNNFFSKTFYDSIYRTFVHSWTFWVYEILPLLCRRFCIFIRILYLIISIYILWKLFTIRTNRKTVWTKAEVGYFWTFRNTRIPLICFILFCLYIISNCRSKSKDHIILIKSKKTLAIRDINISSII
jgi:hypothetical protein